MIELITKDQLLIDQRIQNLCRVPYHNHPKGCPNYGVKEGCPPLPLFDEVYDMNKDLFLIYTIYPVGEFAERMRKTHPQWKDQPGHWYNSRLWQGQADKEHRWELNRFEKLYPEATHTHGPEAHGVNLTALMKQFGIELDWSWPPEHHVNNITYRISLGGYLLD